MGEFRSEGRGRSGGGFGRSRGEFGGRSGGSRGFGGGRGGFGRDRDSGPREMHNVVCTKCGSNCQVPFKPTGNKPVLCSDCFRKEGGGSSGGRSFSRNEGSPGPSSDQLNQINAKLDRIIKVLQELEIDSSEDDESEEVEEKVAEDSEEK
ncbi:MAG: hypothetical protein KKE23_01415 [Nanoarchaeota archaeon]|nr:hypothetical protein [Nanoarchaeota archaeon]